MSSVTNPATPHFIVLPLTGVQIYRRMPLVHLSQQQRDEIWKAAKTARPPARPNEMLGLIRDYVACDQGVEASEWFACSPDEAAFFRLIRIGNDPAVDLVIDTQAGAGRMVRNLVHCVLDGVGLLRRGRHHVASFHVERPERPRNVPGSLVMDFGNTATSFIFSARGEPPLSARPIALINPFDPVEATSERRPLSEKQLFRSTAVLLRIQDHPTAKPWLLLGKRAEEVVPLLDPLVMSLWAPKKYVRDWPEHLRAMEPFTAARGVVGQRTGLVANLRFVQWALEQLLTLAVAAQANPTFSSEKPLCYPQVREVFLTYPYTWRQEEKALFQSMIRSAAEELFVLPREAREQFRVTLLCSEPVAVAAYVLWEVFFHFFHLAPEGKNLLRPSLASALLGNDEGGQELRLLVVDIGGGSTDVALVEAKWAVHRRADEGGGPEVDVQLQVLESLRFNRAGDRLSHLIATAILEFLRLKTGCREPLDFDVPAANPAFTRQAKRAVVWRINQCVEEAKAHFAAHPGEPWELGAAESELLAKLELSRVPGQPVAERSDAILSLQLPELIHWVRGDRQSMRSLGEPGVMDIFHDLEDLGRNLSAAGQSPHLVVLSGRTTRLPFIKAMVVESLRLPAHRVRPVGEVLPAALRGPDHGDIDKLAVVLGAHRMKFGHPIRFLTRPDPPVFRRFVGVVGQTPQGMRLQRLMARPGEAWPRTCKLSLAPGDVLLVGHSFREDGNRAEVIATIENAGEAARDVLIDLVNDHRVELNRSGRADGVRVTERVSGGNHAIVDNYNDTGKIDREPDGLLRDVVMSNADDWIKGGP